MKYLLLSAVAVQAALAITLQGPCNPSTKVFMPAGANAVGETNFIEKQFTSGTCMSIGRYDVKTVKICGPGQFSFSAMTCNQHDYKAVIYDVSKTENTGECSVKDLEPLPDGYLGSYTVTC